MLWCVAEVGALQRRTSGWDGSWRLRVEEQTQNRKRRDPFLPHRGEILGEARVAPHDDGLPFAGDLFGNAIAVLVATLVCGDQFRQEPDRHHLCAEEQGAQSIVEKGT